MAYLAKNYCNNPKYLDRQVRANGHGVDPDQTVDDQGRLCHSVCIFWTHCMLKPYFSNFRILKAFFFRMFQIFTVSLILIYRIDP